MPYVERTPDLLSRMIRRVLIIGAADHGKSRSLLTWPRPTTVFSMPGELGHASLPDHPDFKVFAYGDIPETPNWGEIVSETRREIAKAVTSGAYQTVAIDGLHKLYDCYLHQVTGGASARGEQFDGRKAYPSCNALFFRDLRSWLSSKVPYFVATVWIGRDKDDPGDKSDNAPSHIFPALAGRAGQDICGEFAIKLFAARQGQGRAARFLWQTRPDAKVWGSGLKVSPEVDAKIPDTVPQDFMALEKMLVDGGV